MKTGHVGTNYTRSHKYCNRIFEFCNLYNKAHWFLNKGDKFHGSRWSLQKLWVMKVWKSSQILFAHMLCFCRPSHIYYLPF